MCSNFAFCVLLKENEELKQCSVTVNCIYCNESVPFMDIKSHKAQCSSVANVDMGASSSKTNMVYRINMAYTYIRAR